MNKKDVKRSAFSYLFLILIIASIFYLMNILNVKVNELTYSEFKKALDEGKVTELNINQNGSKGLYDLTGKLKGYKENETFGHLPNGELNTLTSRLK